MRRLELGGLLLLLLSLLALAAEALHRIPFERRPVSSHRKREVRKFLQRSRRRHWRDVFFAAVVGVTGSGSGSTSGSTPGTPTAGTLPPGVNVPVLDVMDYEYVANISIGTPPQNFSVQLDTGSSTFWVSCAKTKKHGRRRRKRARSKRAKATGPAFACSQSSTCTGGTSKFKIAYGKGKAKGIVYNDTVCFGTFCTPASQGVGCALRSSKTVDAYTQGILGLAFPSIDNGVWPPFNTYYQQSGCKQAMFAVYYSSSSAVTNPGGQITVCGIDPTHYVGNITWTPLAAEDYWRITIDSVTLNGVVISSNADAIVDTGTTLLMGPTTIKKTIKSAYGTSKASKRFACSSMDSFPPLVFTIGGTQFPVGGQNLSLPLGGGVCVLGIQLGKLGGIQWILGDVFIRNYYIVFDYSNSRMGFAQLAPAYQPG